MAGQRLTASVSDSNWREGLFYLAVTAEGLFTFVGSNPPQAYREYRFTGTKKNGEPSYVIFKNGSLALYILSAEPSSPDMEFSIPLAASIQYMRLEPDGHLRVYEWRGWWEVAADLLKDSPDECDYPTVCGNYGICSNGQCSCLRENDANVSYFLPLNARQPNLGCYETTPLSCLVTQTHDLLHLQDLYYFNYIDSNSSVLMGIDVESCKQACLKNFSCKAALFGYNGVVSDGSCFLHSQPFSLMNNPTENIFSNSSVDGSEFRTILLGGGSGSGFGCGFFCNGTCHSFLFSIFIVSPSGSPQIVWSANRNNLVGENATLHLTLEGDLVLHNVDGSVAWSTNTSGKSVNGMTILPTGNLVLLEVNGRTKAYGLCFRLELDTGLLYLAVTAEGLFAFAGSNPPQAYREYSFTGTKKNREPSYVIFKNGSLALYILSAETSSPDMEFYVPPASSIQYVRLEPDGHLRVHEWGPEWKVVADLLTDDLGECNYPTICGNYGICLNGQCSCPSENDANVSYFLPVNARQPTLGCYEITPLSCQLTRSHSLLHLQDVSYFNYLDGNSSVLRGTDVESCKQACLNNCSCKAAFFQYDGNISDGSCFLPSQLFSLMTNQRENTGYDSSAFIKVQTPLSSPSEDETTLSPSSKKTTRTAKKMGSVLGSIFVSFLIISINADDNRLHCIVDKRSEDIQLHLEEAVKMIKLGVWCLQSDFTRRPSMSMVVKVLEGVVDMEPTLDYCSLTSSLTISQTEANLGNSTPNFDYSNPEESVLLNLVKRNEENDRLNCMVDKSSEDMQLHLKEAVKMIKLGVWRLQSDFIRRPSMSMVVKVLEDYPSANLSTLWTNNPSITDNMKFTDGSRVRSILQRGTISPRFGCGCGFFCNGSCDSYFFSIFIIQSQIKERFVSNPEIKPRVPQVVWSANPSNPVGENATLRLTQEGDLVLHNVDGSVAWSTNTSGKSVIGMTILETGNLVLFGKNNSIVWQSFEHPTDTLLPGQKFMAGQRLIARVSASNWSQGLFYLSVSADGLYAFAESNPPQAYRRYGVTKAKKNGKTFMIFKDGSLSLLWDNHGPDPKGSEQGFPLPSSTQYIRLDSDGHLRAYEWTSEWAVVADLLTEDLGECDYPTVCGKYGICTNGQCSCPRENYANISYFLPVNSQQPNLGCYETTMLSHQFTQNHGLLHLQDISYFNYIDSQSSVLKGTDVESCKQACLKNRPCKAAFFRYGGNISDGDCFLPSELFSLMSNKREITQYNSSAFIKVQIPSSSASPNPSKKKTGGTAKLVGPILGAIFGAFLIIGIFVVLVKKRKVTEEEEEDCFDQVPGMPARFTYEELTAATKNFCTKLGQGGFGSVFMGTLGDDGTRVAVKRLDNIGQGKKEFLAEVVTVGSIHHFKLVRLIGFCAEKSFRLLVYEYMCNGSLDKWVFHKNERHVLDWKTRWNIISDIAKGLSYLHEECRQRIAHLDIKPQNILLDENFNAKISDFGLSKLIDRDQSQVMTKMRGTRGYLAPEWLSSKITEKVDVYSFGIVVLEIVCGRKNLDYSNPEESFHLLNLVKRNGEDDRLHCLVDKHSEDMQLHLEEAVKMIELGVWCLQSDFTRRPSMSTVVKVLEGIVDMEPILDYSFLTSYPAIPETEADSGISAPPNSDRQQILVLALAIAAFLHSWKTSPKRHTRGYLAREWLNSKITEKVVVYSFGIVVLGIVCGRKNLDYSNPEESVLLNLVKRNEENDRLHCMVDKSSEDM
ncbi:G-type lectin S-receptor-like serine/threonine-protein kinase SD2-5 [Cinnamomum micranthum f. kanehirae]|uniref:non-specific serine/threonine protein kinase n=1 Tax=Cinnamomum micranthum f. kanehirae TaxID=337451 RepID=A0A3S3PEW5_9MAGN|nr:G-type lectin S-receptor-like serine/threonine-protein kinase SD2-5 [Cinnamomum micranthum f. kanehirae]